jgi:hypothetical protein
MGISKKYTRQELIDELLRFEKENGKSIYINPSIYYKGIKMDDVKNLQSMFRI